VEKKDHWNVGLKLFPTKAAFIPLPVYSPTRSLVLKQRLGNESRLHHRTFDRKAS
jgi:hypothetical protein